MTEDNKDFKIEFAPGCFDNFEGTQEELDNLLAEIQNMFAGKTREEIEAMSKPIDEDDFNELPEEVKMRLMKFQDGEFDEETLSAEFKRKLQ